MEGGGGEFLYDKQNNYLFYFNIRNILTNILCLPLPKREIIIFSSPSNYELSSRLSLKKK